MYTNPQNIFNNNWSNTELGKRFINLGFHMFTIDQHLSHYEDKGEDVIRMTLGKSDRPLTKEVINAMKNALDNPADILRVDSEGNIKLRNQISQYYMQKFNCQYDVKNIIIGSQGTSSLYRDIFIMLLQGGGQVLLPKPGYILYEAAARLLQSLCGNQVTIDYYDIDITTNRIDITSFEKAFDADNNRIVVVNSPGNPTGNLISTAEYKDIIRILNTGKRSVLISDQVYGNVVFGNRQYPSILDKELNELLERPYIVTDSMSKGFEMYTFRVGFAMVPNDLIEPLISFQRNFSLTPVTISQFGAIAALQQDEHVKSLEQLYEQRNTYACSNMVDIANIRVLPSEGGFYFLIDCRDFIIKHQFENDLKLAIDIADNTFPHVGTTPGSDFGAPGCLRISLSPQGFIAGIDLLVQYFSKHATEDRDL